MAKQNTAPTMKDVAKEAGVSLGTVSKVINGIPVGDEYRKKVEQAIKTLDYHINAYAKGLKNNRTYTVAVILPNLLNPFFSMVAHYINRALVNRGYRMLLCDTEYDYTKEQEMVQMVAQNKVDGIIALTYNPDLKIPPRCGRCPSTAISVAAPPAWPLITTTAGAWRPRSWWKTAAKIWHSCASAPR